MAGRPRVRSCAIGWAVYLAAFLPSVLLAPSAQALVHRHHWQATHHWQASHRWQPLAEWTAPEKDAALIVDGETGRALYSRNADALRHPASLTKMMTLYLLFEQLKMGQMTLATPISVSEHASIQSPTKLSVRPGTAVPVDTAIKALVVLSANDIAVAIAEAVGGTESHFAEMMTDKARALGMLHTFYHNASGLPDDLQITTANDLALLARHLAYDFPEYYRYFSTPSFTYRGITHYTHDNLIGHYDGADGIKTGYTNASGFNLVSSVVRNGAHVVGVVMGGVTARRRDAEMIRLLDSTFASISFNPELVAHANVPWLEPGTQTAPIIAGFQLTSSQPPRAPAVQLAANGRPEFSNGADDEDAAESRPDPDLDATAPRLSPSIKETPSVVGSPAAPRLAPASSAPVPAEVSTLAALPLPPSPMPTHVPLAGTAAPSTAPAPAATRVTLAAPPPALQIYKPTADVKPAEVAPKIKPRPKPRVFLLASYRAPAISVVLKPRAAILGDRETELPGSPSAPAQVPERQWTIQIGAFADPTLAKAQLASYAARSMDVLGQAAREVIPFQSAEGHTLYRARFGPFPENEARQVCQRLTERGQTCFATLAQR